MTQHDYINASGEILSVPTISVSSEVEATVKKAHYAAVSNRNTNRKYRKKFAVLKAGFYIQSLSIRALSAQQDLLYSALSYVNKTQFWLSVAQGLQWFVTAYLLYERLF